jgi:hybrid cluster-associated redox disulfide protein
MKNKINKDTTLAQILEFGEAEKVLLKYNVPCLGCAFAKMEMEKLKIGDICKMYGIDEENLLKDLNKAVDIYNK